MMVGDLFSSVGDDLQMSRLDRIAELTRFPKELAIL
jgi:hypothetical protein